MLTKRSLGGATKQLVLRPLDASTVGQNKVAEAERERFVSSYSLFFYLIK